MMSGMARKTNALRTLLAAQETAAMKERQPIPPTTAVYELRLNPFRVSLAKARLQIPVQIEEEPQAQCVVKIIHNDPK